MFGRFPFLENLDATRIVEGFTEHVFVAAFFLSGGHDHVDCGAA